MTQRRHRCRSTFMRTVARLVLGLMVCVSLLQMPVPMLHHHATFQFGGQLAYHIEEHHEGVGGPVDDLHWHLVLPREFSRGGDSDDGPSPDDPGLCRLVGQGTVSLETRSDPRLELIASRPSDRPIAGYRKCGADFLPTNGPLWPNVRSSVLLCVFRF